MKTACKRLAPVLLFLALATPPVARLARATDDDGEAVGKVTLLNRRAVEAYQSLNFEDAQRLLRDALDLCEARGLSQHSIRARTYVNLGMVLFGGYKQRSEAIRMFRSALQIAPDIHISRAMANPQIQEVFDEAVRDLVSAPPPPVEPKSTTLELPPERLLVHEPVRTGRRGSAIDIGVSPNASLAQDTLVLSYRAAGATVFTDVRLVRQAGGLHGGTIPGSATAGGQVEYYIEARHPNGRRVTSRGSSIEPLVVVLEPGSPGQPAGVLTDGPHADPGGGHRFVFALLAGMGLGYTSGIGEVRQVQVAPAGIAWSSVGQLAPEIGYFVTPNLLIGVEGRLQFVSGAEEFRPSSGPTPGVCGGDGICSPAKGAFAGFAKGAWYFRTPTNRLRPYVSASLGGGVIRHVAQAGNKSDCGATQNAKCLDTVAAGPFLFGLGAGLSFGITDSVALVGAIKGLGGLPDFTAQGDFDLGVAMSF